DSADFRKIKIFCDASRCSPLDCTLQVRQSNSRIRERSRIDSGKTPQNPLPSTASESPMSRFANRFYFLRAPSGSVDLGAGGPDPRGEALLVFGAVGGGGGGVEPQRDGALLLERLFHRLAVERLLGQRCTLLDHRRRQAGRAADAAPRRDLEAGQD